MLRFGYDIQCMHHGRQYPVRSAFADECTLDDGLPRLAGNLFLPAKASFECCSMAKKIGGGRGTAANCGYKAEGPKNVL